MGLYVQLVAVVTIQLDIGHDGALYHCLSHGSWPNRVIGKPHVIVLIDSPTEQCEPGDSIAPFFWEHQQEGQPIPLKYPGSILP